MNQRHTPVHYLLIMLSFKQNKHVKQKYKNIRGLDTAFEHQMPEHKGTTSLEVEKKDHDQFPHSAKLWVK